LDLLYQLNSKVTRVSNFGETADGPRADVYLEGEVKGKVSGRFQGVDYGLSRVSGNSGNSGMVVIHVHETIDTADGHVSVLRRGYAIPSDGGFKVKSVCLFQTSSPKLEFLNSTIGLAEGYADDKKVELTVFEVV